MPTEIIDDAPVQVLSAERIAQDRAAAQAPPAQQPPGPRENQGPMDGAESDVIGHPSDSFLDMASKLDREMKGLGKKEGNTPTADSSPKDNMQQTDSARKPADKPEDAPAAAAADDKPAEDKVFTSAKAADWKALKDKISKAEAERKAFEEKHTLISKEYEEFRKSALPQTEAEKIRAEAKAIADDREKLQAQLDKDALEKSDKFNSFYTKEFSAAMDLAKNAVGKDHAEKIEQLMQLPPSAWRRKQVAEIHEELDSMGQSDLSNAITAYDRTRAARDEKLANAKVNLEATRKHEEQERAQEAEINKRRTDAVIASVISMAKQNFKDAFTPTGDKAIDSVVLDNEAFVERFFRGKLPENEMALMPIMAIEARRLANTVVPALSKENAELKAALKQYQAGNPAVSGGSPVKPGGAGSGEKSFQSVFMENWPAGNR